VIENLQNLFMKTFTYKKEAKYFVFKGELKNQAYSKNAEPIRILKKDKTIEDVVEASRSVAFKSTFKTSGN
jgi:hypothetical protein